MTFRMIVQLWNTNTSAFVSCDADLTENYMYISMKFGTGVHVFCWEVGVFNRSSFQSVSYKKANRTFVLRSVDHSENKRDVKVDSRYCNHHYFQTSLLFLMKNIIWLPFMHLHRQICQELFPMCQI